MNLEHYMNIESSDEEEEEKEEEIQVVKKIGEKKFASVEKVQIEIISKNGAKRVHVEERPVVQKQKPTMKK